MNVSKYINTIISIYKHVLSFFNNSLYTLIITSTLILAFILAPTNYFLTWRPVDSYINGHFVDYLALKLPPSLVIVIFLWIITLYGAHIARGKLHKKPYFRWTQIFPEWLIILSSWFILRFAVWQWSPATLNWFFVAVLGPYLFSRWILWYSHHTPNKAAHIELLIKTAMGGIFLQALLGSYQYLTQKSLIGYTFLGEPSYKVSSHLAHSTWLPQALTLPYGTTPHPNVLAGWMLLGLVLSLWWTRHKNVFSKKQLWWWIVTPLYLLIMIWSESWNAIISWWLVLSIAYFYHFGRDYFSRIYGFFSSRFVLVLSGLIMQILWVLFAFIPEVIGWHSLAQQPSIARRTHLITVSQQLLEGNWWGTSLRNMFLHIYNSEIMVWGGRFLQPVHNSSLFLLIAFGFWTTFVLLLFMLNVQKKYSLFAMLTLTSLPIFTLDHYLISTLSGQYLLFIFYSFFIMMINTTYPNK